MAEALAITVVVMDIGPVGGMERQLSELVGGMVAAGHDVTVVARTCDLGEVGERVRFVRVPVFQRPFALAYPLFVLFATLLVARHRGDVVHVNGGIVLNRADVYTMHFCHRAYQDGRAAGPQQEARRLYRLNGIVSDAFKVALETFCLRRDRVRSVVAISNGVARETAQWYPSIASRIVVVPYGLDHTRFRRDPRMRSARRAELGLVDGDLAAVFVGGDWGRKRLDVAVAALVGAPAWQLLVVGEGDRRAIQAVADAHGVSDRVRFLGREVHPEGTLNAADVFVFPTTYETFSLATHEAAAAGLPLLVTRVHGVDELLVDGENGWFIDDNPEEVAERLLQLGDAHVRRELGDHATREAARYDWAAAVHGHLQLYAELASE